MVKIPSYTRPVRSERTRVPVDNGIGEAMQSVGNAAQQFAQRELVRIENDQMARAQLDLSNWANEEVARINSLQGYQAEGAARAFSDEYRKKAQSIISKTTSSERVKDAFGQWSEEKRQRSWLGVANYERQQVQQASLATAKLRFQQVQQSAMNGTPREVAMREASEVAAFAVSSGAMLPAEAQASANAARQNILKGAFAYEYAVNPQQAIMNLPESGLTEGEQVAWRDKFADDQWKRFQRQNQYERIMMEREEQARRAIEQETEAQGRQLEESGQLNEIWYEQARQNLSAADSLYYGRKVGLVPPSDVQDNQAVVSDLNRLAASGDMARLQERAESQYVAGNISTETFKRFRQGQMAFDTEIQKEGAQFLRGMFAISDLNPDPAKSRRQTNALSDWNTFVRENQDATPEQMRKEYRRISDAYAFIEADTTLLSGERPRFVETRNPSLEDIDRAESDLVDAFEGKRIGAEEFKRQAGLLNNWRDAVTEKEKRRSNMGAE